MPTYIPETPLSLIDRALHNRIFGSVRILRQTSEPGVLEAVSDEDAFDGVRDGEFDAVLAGGCVQGGRLPRGFHFLRLSHCIFS